MARKVRIPAGAGLGFQIHHHTRLQQFLLMPLMSLLSAFFTLLLFLPLAVFLGRLVERRVGGRRLVGMRK